MRFRGTVLAVLASLLAVIGPGSSIFLDSKGKYEVNWEVFDAAQVIVFNVIVETHGWIGFGISNSGYMLDADIVATQVFEFGELEFKVYIIYIIVNLK
jgi:hypothetical protein